MPAPKIRFYLHSKVAADGRRPVYLSVGIGQSRPVRQATGIVAHPNLFADTAPYFDKRTDGWRSHNERLDDIRPLASKLCRQLEDAGTLSNDTLAPLLRQAIAELPSSPRRRLRPLAAARPAAAPAPVVPLRELPLRKVYERWQQDNSAEFSPEYLAAGNQYMTWMGKFDPYVTAERVDAAWVKGYTKFLVEETPLYNNTIHQHVNRLRVLLQVAGLPSKFIKNKFKHDSEKCYLTWEELHQLHAWQPPAGRTLLQKQKDVFIVRCLTGLRWSDSLALLRPHIRSGGTNNLIRLDQQKTRSQVQVPVLAMAQEILDRYQDEPSSRALPVISRTKTAETIKEILRLAGIDAPFVRVRYKGTKKHEEVMPKWQAAATHTARHTFGTLMARMGIDPFTIRDFMGHADMKSTMVYVHLEAHHGEQSMVAGFNRLAAQTE